MVQVEFSHGAHGLPAVTLDFTHQWRRSSVLPNTHLEHMPPRTG
jgi:hypothetical protein